jgi:hypothetical protein
MTVKPSGTPSILASEGYAILPDIVFPSSCRLIVCSFVRYPIPIPTDHNYNGKIKTDPH